MSAAVAAPTPSERLSSWARMLVGGASIWIALFGAWADLPGAGSAEASAAVWVPFANAALLLAPLLGLICLTAVGAAMLAERRRPYGVEAAMMGAVLFHLVLASAVAPTLGGLGDILHTVPAVTVRALALVLALAALVPPFSAIVSRALLGAGVSLLLVLVAMEGGALGGAAPASSGHRLSAAVMVVVLTAAGAIGLRRRLDA